MKVIAFSCSICGKNYETCPHITGHNYEGSNCSALMSEWKPANIFLVSKSSDSRYRITDMLLITEHKKKKQFVWYGFQTDINSRKLHLRKAVSNNWIPREVFDHFIQFFDIAPLGIATFPPDPLPILERGYRIDLIQSPYEISKKDHKGKNKNNLVLKSRIRYDPDRYNIVSVDNIKYLYDKFDKILLPYPETLNVLMSKMKGAKLYWIKPKQDSISAFINSRLPKIRSFLKSGRKHYVNIDKSEKFLKKLTEHYVSKFVILSIDLKGSTKLSETLSLGAYSNLIGLYTREMSLVIDNYHGYVLDIQGDGIIAYFPIPMFWGMDDNALDCAITMKFLIEQGINKILTEKDIPNIQFRIGLDSGEAMVTTVGDSSSKQQKNLIGNTINLAAKIQSNADANDILIGQTLLERLGVQRRKLFESYTPNGWDYELPSVNGIYPVSRMIK